MYHAGGSLLGPFLVMWTVNKLNRFVSLKKNMFSE